MRKLISKNISYFSKINFKFEYNTEVKPLLKKCRYVYFVLTDRPIEYPNKQKSRVIYIGQTGTYEYSEGHAWKILLSGLCDAVLVSGIIDGKINEAKTPNCLSFYFTNIEKGIPPRDIESAFLYLFREKYGGIPVCNTHGKNFTEEKVKKVKEFHITPEHLLETLKELENE